MKKIKVIVESSGYPGDIYRNETFFIKMTDEQCESIQMACDITGEAFEQYISYAISGVICG